MAHCPHLIEQRDCTDCRPRPAVSSPVPAFYGPWFIAAYDGDCAGCGDEFCEGDEIRADGEGGWLARCCGGGDDIVHERQARVSAVPGHQMTLLERFAAGQLDTGSGI